jgi:NAD-dependent dihydropyrimidine dehydrogenase PreA subunit
LKKLPSTKNQMPEISYGPIIDYGLCDGCGECYESCPMDVFGWDKENKRPTLAHVAECRVCCVCEGVCPQVAIDVKMPLHVRIDFGLYPEI